ncbi:MAG: hypothetical protein R6W77_12475 [Trueperaceae bacterium]
MDTGWPRGTIEGHAAVLVGTVDQTLVWRVEVPLEGLIGFLDACRSGRTLDVRTQGGVTRALARRWWVTPREGTMEVRIALEESATA